MLVPTRGSAMALAFSSGGDTTRPPGSTNDETAGLATRTLSRTSGSAVTAGSRSATGASPPAPPVMMSPGSDQAMKRSNTVDVRRAPAAENMAPPPAMAMTTTARAARTRPVRSAQRASPLTALTTPIVTAPSGRGEGGYLTAGGGAVTPPDSVLLAGPLVAADL